VSIARGDAVALTRELVRVDSRNPSLVAGGPGENAVAKTLAAVLQDWGLRVDLQHAAPQRPNVIARAGRAGGRTLMFNGHLDVVGVDGMSHAPWDAFQREGRIYGRGSADMKSGVAAMCAAAVRAADDLQGQVVITAVVDEEFESIGTRALVAAGVRADAAIVTEPTGLAIMPAHLGFAWADVTTFGRAAHGSRWEIGVDAIRHAGYFLTELDRIDAEDLPQKSHPLLGRPSVHASLIEGGTGMSTYPERCTIRIERRTIPGEKPADVERELREACNRIADYRPGFQAGVRVTFSQEPSDVAVEAPIVRALSQAIRDDDDEPRIAGMSAWTDAAILNAAGIPAICFGPGDIALAHSAEEYVPVFEIERATTILASLAKRWCSARIS
jgi:acetylornithine deacetylase